MFSNESINTERENNNLLSLIKLTLNTLIDHSSSTELSVFDDRNNDVTNFILTLERILNFRLKASWLSERRYFWDFIRPACIGSSRKNVIERVEELSRTKSIKYKGRTWIQLALMEKILSELLKLMISDLNLVRKFYHDDSLMASSQAFILCDQLAGLNALDFSFCFKQDGSILNPSVFNDSDIDVIDLTPFLFYNPKSITKLPKDQSSDEENEQFILRLAAVNELKPLSLTECEMIPLDKHKLEIEQRKYFEELLKDRDRELEQWKSCFEILKNERENEIMLMENIILELQLELRAARNEEDIKRKKSQQSAMITTETNIFNFSNVKPNSLTTSNNAQNQDIDTQMRPIDSSNLMIENVNQMKNSDDFTCSPDQFSRRSSHSTTTTNTDDDQYEVVRRLTSNNNQISTEIKTTSSPEMISSVTSLSTASSSSSSTDDNESQEKIVKSIENSNETIINESGRFESVEMTSEQANLLEEVNKTV
ncbi:unnamed protein product [Rotaria socialis]|uniref:RUN domain-containing protein n=1 Tax=Rotaria socialis TaxID=392032 RepID=A0A818BLZ7_9BILA|nr:unnamed protein product [Rotaria socialis]CAF4222209.1 unnamed protein product [Rotaria socialis]